MTSVMFLSQASGLINYINQKVLTTITTGNPADLLGGPAPTVKIWGVQNAFQTPSVLPASCSDERNCQWACNNFFGNGSLNVSVVGTGGVNMTLVNPLLGSFRLLDGGANYFDPDDYEAGMNFSFPVNVSFSSVLGLNLLLCLFSFVFIL